MYATKLIYSNPFVTEAMVKKMYGRLSGLVYTPSNVKWRGNPAHEAGDAVRLIDRSGVAHTILIMSQTISFGGGLNSQISCPGETGDEVEQALSTPTGQQIASAVGQSNADMTAYVTQMCEQTLKLAGEQDAEILKQAKAYTDEVFGNIVNGNEVAY